VIYVLTLKALLYINFPPLHTSPPRPRMPNVKGSLARVVITYMTKEEEGTLVLALKLHVQVTNRPVPYCAIKNHVKDIADEKGVVLNTDDRLPHTKLVNRFLKRHKDTLGNAYAGATPHRRHDAGKLVDYKAYFAVFNRILAKAFEQAKKDGKKVVIANIDESIIASTIKAGLLREKVVFPAD